MTANARPLHRSPAFWLFVVACALEFFLFDHFGSRRVTGIYPRWNDQIQYLGECYTGYEYGREHGVLAGLWHALTNPSAQGTLHDFAAVLAFQFVGPSRSAALALNMLALIAWQAALFAAFVRHTGSRWFSLAVAILPLALAGPWVNVPGSAYDFRLDHFAMCALGVTSGIALLTDGLRRRAASVAFGVAVGVTLLTRFLTGTYFVVMLVLLLGWIIASDGRRARLQNLALAVLVAALVAGPILWLNREWVWNYYYIGHYVGPESAIRNQNFGLGKSLAYVFGWLGERHLGVFFGGLFAAGAVALAIVRFLTRNDPESDPARAGSKTPHLTRQPIVDVIMWGGVFLFGPALVLTLHPQKSEVVLSALSPGVVLLAAAVWQALAANAVDQTASFARRTLPALATGVTVAALSFFAIRQFSPVEDPARLADLRQVNALADYVFERAQAAKRERPRVAVDNITDALDGQVLRVICYERHRVWKDFDMRLPTGIAEPETSLVKERIADSDFVFLTAEDAPAGPFPFDRKLAALRPELRVWCEAHLKVAKQFTFSGHPVVLYQRPEIPLR